MFDLNFIVLFRSSLLWLLYLNSHTVLFKQEIVGEHYIIFNEDGCRYGFDKIHAHFTIKIFWIIIDYQNLLINNMAS